MANIKNLKPNSERTPKELREQTIKGGIASGKARREKKLMSKIYGDFLADKFKVRIDGEDEQITGEKLVDRVIKQVLVTGGGPAVSLLKEIREATEGSNVKIAALDLPQIIIAPMPDKPSE